jgi:hypothetical protein
MVAGGAGLKDCFLLQWPWRRGIDSPGGQAWEKGGGRAKILPMIRSEIKTRALPHPAGDSFQEVRLQQAVLVVALLRPRIGKQDPEFGEGDIRREGIDRFARLGLEKVAMREPGALGLAFRPADPVADQVHAEEKALRELRGVSGQEMAMSRADFQRERGAGGDKFRQLGT